MLTKEERDRLNEWKRESLGGYRNAPHDDVLEFIDRLVADVERLRAAAEKEEVDGGQVLDERDSYHDRLDQFVEAVGGIDVCGEHSNANDPWARALEEVERLRARNEALEKVAKASAKLAEWNFSVESQACQECRCRPSDAAELAADADALSAAIAALNPSETPESSEAAP